MKSVEIPASDQTIMAPVGRSKSAESRMPTPYPTAPIPNASASPERRGIARVAMAGTIRLAKTRYTPTSWTDAVTVSAKSR